MIRVCPSCKKKNRVPAKHLADVGTCGHCKAKMPASDAPINVSAKAFDDIVGGSDVPVLVDFWADWCGPCRMVAPAVKEAAKTLQGRALVLKVDTEANPGLSARYGVRGIPNFIVLHRGKVVHQQAGAVDAGTLVNMVRGVL